MDSIAAPVQDIQYPTITVCQDENKPPDNWALLELIFNNFALECEYSTYYGLPPCNSTSKIRSDFKFLIETVLSMIRGLMKQPEFRGNSFSVLSGDVEELVEKIAVSLTNGEVKFGDLSNLPNMYFGVKSDLETILKQTINETDDEYIGFYFYYATQEPPINCTSKQCQEYLGSAWSIVQTLAEVTLVQPNLPFGSIFGKFIPQLYEEFCAECLVVQPSLELPSFNSQKNCALTTDDQLLHGIFASMSKYLGFENPVSLFDVPAILSTTKIMGYGDVSKSQSFSYSWCQNNMSVDNSEVCYMSWKYYSEMAKPNGNFH